MRRFYRRVIVPLCLSTHCFGGIHRFPIRPPIWVRELAKSCLLHPDFWSGITIFTKECRAPFVDAFLLQAWNSDPDVYFSYSGIAWFLSALIFCYFMSPLLLRYAKKVKQSVVMFIIVAFIRVSFEYLEKVVPVWGISIHTFPIIRCMEFFLGMLMVPLFVRTADKIRSTGLVFGLFSIIEIAMTAMTVFLMVKMNGVWMRGIFVLL